MGLFLVEDADKGDRVAKYSGDVLDAQQAKASKSQYLFEVNKNYFLDGKNKRHKKGRYINEGSRAGKVNNVTFSKARKVRPKQLSLSP